MLAALVLLALPALQLPERRLPALELGLSDANWQAYLASGRPGLGTMGLLSIVSNDGRFIYQTMPLAIYDTERDRTLPRENVFDGKLNGREVILTDSQAGHFRGRFTDLQGPHGKLLGVFGLAYVVAVHDENVDNLTVGEIHPDRRGADSNRILGEIPTDERQLWSWGGGNEFDVASVRLADWKKNAAQILTYRVVWNGHSASLRLASRMAVPYSLAQSILDIDIERQRAILGQANSIPPPEPQGCFIADLRTGKRHFLAYPPGHEHENSDVMFAAGKVLCWFPLYEVDHWGGLYVSSDERTWRFAGNWNIEGMSFDRRLALISSRKEVWLRPVDKL